MIELNENNLRFIASRSSGPGGQNVNKLNTRITLWFDLRASNAFSDAQKQRIMEKLRTRVDKSGCIRVSSQKYRTQRANRDAALERMYKLLEYALKTDPVRKKTRIPASYVRKRLENKKQRSQIKKQRSFRDFDQEG